MIPITNVSIVGILAASVVAMIVGMVWYSPPLFGNLWMEAMGVNPKKAPKMDPKSFGGAFLGALLSASVLAVLIKGLLALTIMDGFAVALWVWLGFYVALELVALSFSAKRSVKLFLVNIGHHLVALLAMSAVLVLLG